MTTEKLLEERGKTHGDYSHHARCTQAIMRAVQAEKNWGFLPDEIKESIHMIAHKLGRIATGNPYIKDHYDDIAGYSVLVAQRVQDGVGMKPNVDATTAFARVNAPSFILSGTAGDSQNNVGARVPADPTAPGPEGTEPQDVSHAIESFMEAVGFQGKPAPEPPVVPRAQGVHLTQDHVGMYFRRADGYSGKLFANDGPEPERFPFKMATRRYTEYGFCAAADGDPIHDIVGHHPH